MTEQQLARTVHLRLPADDLRQVEALVPARYIDRAEALRALLRKGMAVELRKGGE